MDDHDLPSRAQLNNASVAPIPARLLASWRRSENYGVSLDDIHPAFTGTYNDESLFFECGQQVISELYTSLSTEPVGLMLTDADGLVLNRLSGDRQLLHALDSVHLAPGFSYSERQAGTNGLGLALADRVPSLVRADDHYSLRLCGYTCAAAPVFDPLTGRLEGAINLTTWSDSHSDLLLALAQTAAASTANLMLARSTKNRPRTVARGQVSRVGVSRSDSHDGLSRELSGAWTDAVSRAEKGLRAHRIVAAIGERGSGRATLLAQAERLVRPRDYLLAARAPAPHEVERWMSLWTPELNRSDTGFVICDIDDLPAAAADDLARLLTGDRGSNSGVIAVTAESFDNIPSSLAAAVGTVVHMAPLRERTADILPLADHFARRTRNREIGITAAAARALTAYEWPGNVAELAATIREAAVFTENIDVRHLRPEILSRSEPLPNIRAFERDEIVRVLTRPGITMEDAVLELGLSRATVYRRLRQYGLQALRQAETTATQ